MDAATPEERAERMVELVDRENGYQSVRFVGQTDLLWHSADKELMAERLKAMRASVAGAIRSAVAAEREQVTDYVNWIRDTDPAPDQRATDYQAGYNESLSDVLAFVSGNRSAFERVVKFNAEQSAHIRRRLSGESK